MEQRQFDIVKTYQSTWVKDADIVLNIEGGTMDGYSPCPIWVYALRFSRQFILHYLEIKLL